MKSVLAKEEAQSDEIRWIQPSNDVQGDSDNENAINAAKPAEKKPLSHQPSFEKSIKSGATRIMNPKNKKRMETCLVEMDSTQGLQTALAAGTNDIDEQNWIQPGTTADDDDTSETGQSSILQEFRDTISETLHHLHLPHHAKPDGAINKHGLLETAMETMLIEQASIMGAQPVAAPADHVEHVKFEDKRNSSIESFKKLLVSPFRRRSNDSNDSKSAKKEPKKDKFSLFDSAMKTMLNETAHIIEGVGVHPKSFDEDDNITNKLNDKTQSDICAKIQAQEHKIDSNDSLKSETIDSQRVDDKNVSQSYSKFCNNLTMSHVLSDAEPSYSTGQSTSEAPQLTLTKCKSKQLNKKPNEIDLNDHIDSKSHSPDTVSIDNKTLSPTTERKSNLTINQDNNLSKTLIHSHSGDLINLTNITKLLAPDPHPKPRSHDEKSVAVGAAANKHTRTESSSGTKTQSSPTKVPTSSSSYNTSSQAQGSAKLSTSKDGKDAKETICRRSSDSDLSVTPKGNHLFDFID